MITGGHKIDKQTHEGDTLVMFISSIATDNLPMSPRHDFVSQSPDLQTSPILRELNALIIAHSRYDVQNCKCFPWVISVSGSHVRGRVTLGEQRSVIVG